MRLTSIEAVNNELNKREYTPLTGAYLQWIQMLHNKSLYIALNDEFIRINVGAGARRLDERHLAFNVSSILNLPDFAFNKFYTFLLCYVEQPPHPYGNVFSYLADNFEAHKHDLPKFSLIREWCHTYKYQLIKHGKKPEFENLLGEIPRRIRLTNGVHAYNKYLLSFVRLSEVNNNNLSYVPDVAHREKDVQVSTSINRVLNRVIENDGIRARASAKLIGNVTELKIAEGAEELTRVYEKGPRSCMSGICRSVEGYSFQVSPAAVYDTKTVGVIYGERGNTITGRAVINKQRKEYTRAYGDTYFIEALNQAGYEEEPDCLRDCYLKRIPLEKNSSTILLPYLDGELQGVKVENTQLKIVSRNYDYFAEYTSGIFNLDTESPEEGPLCENCEEHTNEDDIRNVGGRAWCMYCVENDAIAVWTNIYDQEYYPWNEEDRFIEIDGEFYYDRLVAGQHDFVEDVRGEWQQLGDVYEFEGEYYLEDYFERYGLTFNEDGEVCKDDVEDEAA